MKKISVTLLLVAAGLVSRAQVGMSCQYFPGVQVGFVNVKTSAYGNYKYGAGLPILVIDRVKNHWYTNLDFSAFYYGATQTNKAQDNRVKISKAEGAVYAGRLGYLFGNGERLRIGPNLNIGVSTSNLDSIIKPMDQVSNRGYYNYGIGVVAYQKFGKLRFMGKAGFEKYAQKKFITKASGFYLEGTIGYSIYQKYGISVSTCFYRKSFNYSAIGETNATDAKVSSFVLKMGLTRFF